MNDFAVGIVLAIHLMMVNLCTMGPLVCIWLEWKEANGCGIAGTVGRKLALWSLMSLLLGSLVGLAGVGLLWNDEYRAVVASLSSRINYGGVELLFSFVLMLAHCAWWRYCPGGGRARVIRCVLLLLAGSNLLYHFPPLLVIMSQLLISPLPGDTPVTSAQFRSMMMQGVVLSRSTHFLLASAAVTGVAMMMLGLSILRRGDEEGKRAVVWGGRLALVPTLLQLGVGVWVLLQLPESQQKLLMGSDLTATVVFLLSLITAFALMHRLAAVAMGKTVTAAAIRWSAMLLLLTIVLMTLAMRRARSSAEKVPVRFAGGVRSIHEGTP